MVGTKKSTLVKFKNPFGTCWGFSAVAVAEISLLGSVYKDDAHKRFDCFGYFAFRSRCRP